MKQSDAATGANCLTIIVPVRNRAELVVRTLDSIAAASERPQRLVIVDNGSTDATLSVCRTWAEAHADMDIAVVQEPQAGASRARNRGLREVETEWVYFFDSDDDMDVSFVSDITQALPTVSSQIVFTPVCQEFKRHRMTRPYIVGGGAAEQILSSMFSTVTLIFRTAWLRKLGGWDEQLTTWDDWELGIRALINKPAVDWMTRRAYHLIHVHAESQTGASFTQTLDATLTAMRHAADDIASAPLSTQEQMRCQRALYLRAQIMSGQLLREGNATASHKYNALASELLPEAGALLKLSGAFLRWYVHLGFRGAWRLALKML